MGVRVAAKALDDESPSPAVGVVVAMVRYNVERVRHDE